jgi:uncharacterized delta-60 repeat protein
MHRFVLLTFMLGCGEVQKIPDDFAVTTDPTSVFVRRNQAQSVMVNVTRNSGTAPIDVTVDGLPNGVTADPLSITDTGGMLTLHAGPSADEGIAMLTVHGTVGDVVEDGMLRLLVGDAPGTLDLSFGGNGKFVTTLPGTALVGRGLSLAFGGVLVTGVNTGMSQTVSAKIREDGTLDPAFGSNGIVSTGAGAFAEGIAIATTQTRIIIAGVANGNGTSDDNYGVFAYLPDGSLDTTFGASGVASIDPGTNTFAEYHTVVTAADGTVFASGTNFPPTGGVLGQGHKFTPNGTQDPTFAISEANVNIEASVLQPDGKLVIAGGQGSNMFLGRYTATGAHDAGFGTGGIVTTAFGSDSVEANGVVLLPGGKLLACGTSSGATAHIVLARYNANGSLDLTFGTSGTISTAIAFDTRSPNGVVMDSDNHILIVGVSGTKPAVARVNPDGTPDTTFGTNGIAAIDFGIAGSDSQTGGYGIILDGDGRVLFTGEVGNPGMQRLVAARLWP